MFDFDLEHKQYTTTGSRINNLIRYFNLILISKHFTILHFKESPAVDDIVVDVHYCYFNFFKNVTTQ